MKYPRSDPPDCLRSPNPSISAADGAAATPLVDASSLPENAQKCSRDRVIKHSLGVGREAGQGQAGAQKALPAAMLACYATKPLK